MNYLNLIRNRIKQLNLDKKTIVILIVGFLGIFVMFLSEFNGQEDDSEEMVTYNTDEEYCIYLENKIQSYIEKIDGKVESIPLIVRFKGGLNKLNFRLATPQGPVGVSIFNRAFLKSQLTVGTGITVIGKLDKSKNVITASDIKMGVLSNKVRIEPVYHCTSGLTNKNISTFIKLKWCRMHPSTWTKTCMEYG